MKRDLASTPILVASSLFISFFTLQSSCTAQPHKDKKDRVSIRKPAAASYFQLAINEFCNYKDSVDQLHSLSVRTGQQTTNLKTRLKVIADSLLVLNNNGGTKSGPKEKKAESRNLKSLKQDKSAVINSNDSLKFVKTNQLRLERIERLKLENDSLAKEVKRLAGNSDSLQKASDRAAKRQDESARKVIKESQGLNGGIEFDFCGVRYHAFVADLDSHDVRLHLFNKSSKKQNLFSIDAVHRTLLADSLEPLMITNAGMFDRDYRPVGLFIDQRTQTYFSLDTSTFDNGENFYLLPNGVFYIDTLNRAHVVKTKEYIKVMKQIKPRIATQSGPMLLIDGKVHDKITQGSSNRKIRSGVGVISPKKIVFATSLNESNFYDHALIYKELFGCNDALFLDGAISLMYIKGFDSSTGGNFGPMISITKKR